MKSFNLAAFFFLSLFAIQMVTAESDKPNILIIFTDDQGYADLGCFGSKENQTPVLDKLAKEGTKFTSFYAQPVCGPSCSALLTGRYPVRSKGWSMPASEITFAEMLKEVGYQTACVGKWDVSNRKAIVERMPNAQGFDYYFGALGANDSGKSVLHSNNELVGTTDDMAGLTRLYTDKAVDYLVNQRDSQKPFLLYLSHTMMHTIIDASPKFKKKTGDNLYRAVVEEFDFETGRLLETLEKLGLKENTLVIFTTDNGPWNQPKYYEKKKGIPRIRFSGAMPDPCVMEKHRFTRAVSVCPVLCVGREKSPREKRMTVSWRRSISCPPLPRLPEQRFPMTELSMELINWILFWVNPRQPVHPSFITRDLHRCRPGSSKGMLFGKGTGNWSLH